MKFFRSSKSQVVLVITQMLPAAVLLLLVLVSIVSWVAKEVVQHQARERLDQQAVSLANATQIKLDDLRDATRALAANQLLVNGLIDTVGRDNYLPAFFRSLRLPGPDQATITLTDYRGRAIASTDRTASYEDVPWLRTVMGGEEHFDLALGGLIIVAPVRYAGMPEGAVVVEYPSEKVGKLLQVPSTAHATAVLDRYGAVLYSTEPGFAVAGRPIVGAAEVQWIESNVQLPEYSQLDLVAATPVKTTYGPLAKIDQFLFIALIADILVLVAGTLFTGRTKLTRIPIRDWWLPASVALGVIMVTGFLWIAQDRQEELHQKQILTNVSQSIASSIRAHLQYRVDALQRMAERWSVMGKPARETWELDAKGYVNHFGDFQALEWVDASYRVRWVVPLSGNEQAQGLDLASEPHRRAALEVAMESRDITMTRPISLAQGGKGFLVYCPIYHESKFEGFILGVFRFDQLFQGLGGAGDWAKYESRFQVGEELIWGTHLPLKSAQDLPDVGHRESFALYGVPWTIHLPVSDHLLSESQSSLKFLTLIIGVSVGILLVVMARQAQTLRRHATKIDRANRQLQSEVAEREQVQSNLSRSERLFRSTIEASPSGMIMVDREGVITLVNEQIESMFGYTRKELLGQKVEILLPTEIRGPHVGYRTAFFDAPAVRAMGQGRDLSGQRKDGTTIPIETALNPLETPNGMQVLATVVDITERKRSQETLRRSEELFRTTIQASPSGMIMVDREGVITLVNEQIEPMFGYARDELLGQKIEQLVPPAIREAHVGYRTAFLGSPDSRAMGAGRDLSGHRKDGTAFPVEIGLNPLETPHGVQVLATVVDITERKQHDLLLRRQMAQLEQANEDLDEFAYVASHDLRSPLEGIKKIASWIIKDNTEVLPDKSKRHLEQMQQRIDRLENLLGDLLQYSRAGRVSAEPLSIDTGQLVRDIAELAHRPKAFTVSAAPDMPTLVTARPPLEQVLRNLISNAIKHHDRPDGTLTISCQPNGRFVEFEISDDGPGIDPQFHDQIFGLFETLRPRDEVEGSGMGLAIVKKLVERYGGKISVASENGRGTTFRFTWPKTMD